MVGVFTLVYMCSSGCVYPWKLPWHSEITVSWEKGWGNMNGKNGMESSELCLLLLTSSKPLMKGRWDGLTSWMLILKPASTFLNSQLKHGINNIWKSKIARKFIHFNSWVLRSASNKFYIRTHQGPLCFPGFSHWCETLKKSTFYNMGSDPAENRALDKEYRSKTSTVSSAAYFLSAWRSSYLTSLGKMKGLKQRRAILILKCLSFHNKSVQQISVILYQRAGFNLLSYTCRIRSLTSSLVS